MAPGDYQQALAPYGAWVDDGSYGQVWRPPVDEDWQPYVDGSWAWTGDGWTWESDDPWGWTFHYGRWALSPVFGWVWVPGDVWGPAWVDWFWGDGFVGWAPLSPLGGAVISTFVFVDEANFCNANLRHAVLDAGHVPRAVIHDAAARHHRPTIGGVARVTHSPVRLGNRPRQTIAPWDRHDDRPQAAGVQPVSAPVSDTAAGPLAPGGLEAPGADLPSVTRLGAPVLQAPAPPPPVVAMPIAPRHLVPGVPRFFSRPTVPPALARSYPGRVMRPGTTLPRARPGLQGRAERAHRL